MVAQTVLFITNNWQEQKNYQNYLQEDKQGKYIILEASTGEEALALCQQIFPDVIVMDVLLLDMDMLTFFNNFKSLFGQTSLPIIILTGQQNGQIAAHTINGSAADYLLKKEKIKLSFIKPVENLLENTDTMIGNINIPQQMKQNLKAAHEQLLKQFEEQTARLEQLNQLLLHEITERQRIEAELRLREQQFSTLVENSPDIIFRLDCDLRHTYISPQVVRESGITTQYFLGKTGREIGLPTDACDVFEAACYEALTTKKITRVEYSIADKQYVSRLIPEHENGVVKSLIGITENVTQYKSVEHQCHQDKQNIRSCVTKQDNQNISQ